MVQAFLFAAAMSQALATGMQEPVERAPEISGPRPVNLVFVVDLSGSMHRTLTAAKFVMAEVWDAHQSRRDISDLKAGILLYGSASQELGRLPLTSDPSRLAEVLRSLRIKGTGAEFVPEFLDRALKEFDWDPRAEKHLILVGNETPWQGPLDPYEEMEELKGKGITGSAVWCNWHSAERRLLPPTKEALSVALAEQADWKKLAEIGGGFYFEVDGRQSAVLEASLAARDLRMRQEHQRQRQLYQEINRQIARQQLGRILKGRRGA